MGTSGGSDVFWRGCAPRTIPGPPAHARFFRPCGAGRSFAGLPGPRPVFGGASGPGPRGTFCPCKKYPKTRQPAAGALDFMFCLGAQRQGLVWSIDGADCGAAGQKRLPLRRALRAYHSLDLGACRSIHMKCGAISALVLLFCRSSCGRKTDGSTPLTGPKAEVRPETRLRSDARRICYSVAGSISFSPRPIRQRDSKTVGFGGPLPTFPPWGK